MEENPKADRVGAGRLAAAVLDGVDGTRAICPWAWWTGGGMLPGNEKGKEDGRICLRRAGDRMGPDVAIPRSAVNLHVTVLRLPEADGTSTLAVCSVLR